MKKTITLLALSVAFGATAQVTNGGFENWTDQFLYDDPTEWETGNWQDGNSLLTTTQVTTMAPSGNFAVRLETIALPDDTAFGFILQGEIDEDPEGGIPWSTEVQTIEGYARYDVMPGDTAIMVFFGWDGGNIVAEDAITFVGSQTTWMPFTHTLNMGPVTPDSILIAAASSNAINEIGITPGSWLELDAIELNSPNEPNPDMIPNYDFENWIDISAEDPDDWSSYNELVAGFGFTSVDKSTDANSGMYSALIKTEIYEGDTLPGTLTNGSIGNGGPSGGVPYAAMPTNFSGAYKYMPNGQDTAHIVVLLTSNGSLVGISDITMGQATPVWTPFNEPVTVLSEPDTMSILIFSGDNGGSMLYIDDLDLTGGTVGLEELGHTDIKVFPNPVMNNLTLVSGSDLGRSELTIIDLSGRVLVQQRAVFNTSTSYSVDLSDLPNGTYILELSKGDERYRERIVKE